MYIYIYTSYIYNPTMHVYILEVCIYIYICIPCYLHKTVHQDFEEAMLGVKRNTKGNILCMFVQQQFALKFLDAEPHRKVAEIRSKPVKFLIPGDRLCLATGSHLPGQRQALGVLEFKGQMQIQLSLMSKYFALHQVPAEEANALSSKWNVDSVWLWNLELCHAFDQPLVYETPRGSELWHYVDPKSFLLPNRDVKDRHSLECVWVLLLHVSSQSLT